MILLIRSNDIFSDPRAMKYVRYFDQKNIEYKLLGWNRDKVSTIDNRRGIYFNKKAGYNVGGLKAVFNRVRWIIFVLKTLLFKLRADKIIIHACDLDAAFPAVVFKILTKRKVQVIFDIFDWYSDTLYNQKKYILNAFVFMERLTIKYSDYYILCEEERINQIPYQLDETKILILPNIPYFDKVDFLSVTPDYSFNNDKITFSYVGVFSEERCIHEIINIAKSGYINLLIAGFGNTNIEHELSQINSLNIKYFGKVNYQIGLNIMFNSDIIYAMYAKTNPNHIYAAPNKFYEAMLLGKAIFSTRGIIIQNKISKWKTGVCADDNYIDIKNQILGLNKDEIEKMGLRAYQLWIDKYCSYTENFLNGIYTKVINDHL